MAPLRSFLPRILFVLALATAPALAAEPVLYALDPVHTRVMVTASHAGFSQAIGTVSGSEGELRFDPADWTTASLDVRVPLARLGFGDRTWNRAVQGRGLLDVAKHPVARFVSSSVTPRDERHAEVCGDLTLRGVTKPLCLDVTFNQLRRHPFPPFRRTAGFSATGTLSRRDFGITAWKTVIGDEVTLRIEAEAYVGRARNTLEATAAPSPAPGEAADAPADTPPPDEATDTGEPAPEPEPEPTDEPAPASGHAASNPPTRP